MMMVVPRRDEEVDEILAEITEGDVLHAISVAWDRRRDERPYAAGQGWVTRDEVHNAVLSLIKEDVDAYVNFLIEQGRVEASTGKSRASWLRMKRPGWE